MWRSCGSVGKAIAWTAEEWDTLTQNSTLTAGVRRAVAETQRVRALVSTVDAEFWPLTPIDPVAPWATYEHVTHNGSTGFALVFHRPNSSQPDHTKLVRLVTNRTEFKWVMISTTGYYRGKYYFTPASNAATALEACQQACSTTEQCEGFTFVPRGGPPCALYSSIDGPFTGNAHVSQMAKLYDCGLDSSGIRPFMACGSASAGVFAPNCEGADCGATAAAKEGTPGCPPYTPVKPPTADFSLELRSLQDAAIYDVSLYHDSYEQTSRSSMKGIELRNLTVSLPSRSVLLVWFAARSDRVKTDDTTASMWPAAVPVALPPLPAQLLPPGPRLRDLAAALNPPLLFGTDLLVHKQSTIVCDFWAHSHALLVFPASILHHILPQEIRLFAKETSPPRAAAPMHPLLPLRRLNSLAVTVILD